MTTTCKAFQPFWLQECLKWTENITTEAHSADVEIGKGGRGGGGGEERSKQYCKARKTLNRQTS